MSDRFLRSSCVTGLVALTLLASLAPGSAPLALAQNAAAAPKAHRKVLVMFDPEYPNILKNGRFEGQVRLEATVLPNGSVSKVDVKGGNPMLAQCGVQAVQRWKYAPGPAQTIEEVVFNFNSTVR